MNQLPSRLQTSLPMILGAVGAFMTVLGTGYETYAQSHPEVTALLGWPAGLSGVLTTIGAFVVGLRNQSQAAGALPKPPVIDGEVVDDVVHLVTMAVGKDLMSGDSERAQRLKDALYPKADPMHLPGPGETP